MKRPVKRNKPTDAQQRIREAEANLSRGVRETIRIDERDLSIVADIIEADGVRKADVLRRAVSLGLHVMRQSHAAPEVSKDTFELLNAINRQIDTVCDNMPADFVDPPAPSFEAAMAALAKEAE